ncbi:MAG: thioredoxin [Candidatus Neomarinimicrobiota bacterium]|nr:MAG: thioredoxin [Candidatus Neomarinimicrobiota bacterium]
MTGKVLLTGLLSLTLMACSGKGGTPGTTGTAQVVTTAADPIVTFIELGSVNCIPCKKMQPVMADIEHKYGPQVKVMFYDVWKDDAPAKQYGIRLIPTQVFLDRDGREFFRHEGFLPEDDIDRLLTEKGLQPRTGPVS